MYQVQCFIALTTDLWPSTPYTPQYAAHNFKNVNTSDALLVSTLARAVLNVWFLLKQNVCENGTSNSKRSMKEQLIK